MKLTDFYINLDAWGIDYKGWVKYDSVKLQDLNPLFESL